MKLLDTIKNGVYALATIGKYNVYNNQTNTMYAFITELGLCLVGLYQIGNAEGSIDYFDLRCRFYLGEIDNNFNPMQALKINHDTNDAKYGFTIIQNRPILTASDQYRFLISWGDKEIKNTIKARFGGYLVTPLLMIPGIIPLNSKFYINNLNSIGIDNLLNIKNIVNYELFEKEI